MAFSAGEWTYLNPGQSAYWSYDWGSADLGPQVATPQPFGTTGAIHAASEQGKAKYRSGLIQYYVTITNLSASTGDWHRLSGGGLT